MTAEELAALQRSAADLRQTWVETPPRPTYAEIGLEARRCAERRLRYLLPQPSRVWPWSVGMPRMVQL